MVSIRKGSLLDLAEVQRLNQALFQHEREQRFYSGDSFNLKWPYEEAGAKYFKDCLSGTPASVVFIAEANGQTAGYLAATCAAKSFLGYKRVAELDNMFVEARFRSQGTGSKLVDTFKSWALQNQASSIRVGAFALNHRALKFYRRHGFADREIYLEQLLSHDLK